MMTHTVTPKQELEDTQLVETQVCEPTINDIQTKIQNSNDPDLETSFSISVEDGNIFLSEKYKLKQGVHDPVGYWHPHRHQPLSQMGSWVMYHPRLVLQLLRKWQGKGRKPPSLITIPVTRTKVLCDPC
ncbi:hypothetical protein J6590_005930 [Homalodisca vitripennis]|nr:hypothetical protein J6590_005930 [Homalodisca vitripennis]